MHRDSRQEEIAAMLARTSEFEHRMALMGKAGKAGKAGKMGKTGKARKAGTMGKAEKVGRGSTEGAVTGRPLDSGVPSTGMWLVTVWMCVRWHASL